MNFSARDYQAAASDAAMRQFAGGDNSTLLVMATGTGKTVVAGLIAQKARELNKRTLFLAHQDSLVRQAAKTFRDMDFDVAVEMADERAKPYGFTRPQVVVASVQTMQGARLKTWLPREFGLLICDEAHHSRASSYGKIFTHFKDHWLVGITATPDRGDKKNLGTIYQSIAFEYGLAKAVRDEWAAPPVRVVCETGVNLDDIRTTGGDYNLGDLEERIGPHIERLARSAMNEIQGRKTVVFTPDVGSSQATANAFQQLGRNAEWIAGSPRMSRTTQVEVLGRYSRGETDLVVCCDKLIEGWDDPATSAVVIMRPTRKRSRFCQMVGRATRPYPGKNDCLIVDFSWETTENHSLVCAFDLFDDTKIDKETLEIARKLEVKAREQGFQKSMLSLIDEAIDQKARATELSIKMTGEVHKYRAFFSDPLGISNEIGVKLNPEWDFGGGISVKQAKYLEFLGVRNSGNLTKMGASKMIAELTKRRERNLATPKQIHYAIALGLDPEIARTMLFDEAKNVIRELSEKQ